MAQKTRPVSDAQADRDLRLAIHNRTVLAQSFSQFCKYAFLIAASYYGYHCVLALAGKNTAADIGIKFLSDIRISEAAAWLFGAGGVLYGTRERRLRLKVNESLGARVSELEEGIDPARSSSKLTPRGETNPQDHI